MPGAEKIVLRPKNTLFCNFVVRGFYLLFNKGKFALGRTSTNFTSPLLKSLTFFKINTGSECFIGAHRSLGPRPISTRCLAHHAGILEE